VQPGSFGKLIQYFRLSYFTILPIPVAYCPCIFPYTLSCHLTPFSPVVLGNTNFESIPHPLVTFIMSQCVVLIFITNSSRIVTLPADYLKRGYLGLSEHDVHKIAAFQRGCDMASRIFYFYSWGGKREDT